MVNTDRFFIRQYPHGVVTDQMKEMLHSELLEYCGQLYRRLDRIIAIMDRARDDKECEHTLESVMVAIGRHASNEFDERCLGYDQNAGEDDDVDD